jgi:hypothetical protein
LGICRSLFLAPPHRAGDGTDASSLSGTSGDCADGSSPRRTSGSSSNARSLHLSGIRRCLVLCRRDLFRAGTRWHWSLRVKTSSLLR